MLGGSVPPLVKKSITDALGQCGALSLNSLSLPSHAFSWVSKGMIK